MPNYREWLRALRTAVAVGRKQHVTVTAAGLGYYAFNSFVPLLLLVSDPRLKSWACQWTPLLPSH